MRAARSITRRTKWHLDRYYNAAILEKGVGVRFKGVEKTNVEEYCVSEGWVRLAVGKTLDRQGKQLTIKYTGEVEPYFKDEPAS